VTVDAQTASPRSGDAVALAPAREAELTSRELLIVEATAMRVVELLRNSEIPTEDHAPGLLTASQLAAKLGVQPRFVYDHAAMLGAARLGPKGENADGNARKPRLRFDLETARAALSRYGSGQSQRYTDSAGGGYPAPAPRRSSSLASRRPKRGHILQSRPRNAAR
jgi:hypothetical protein